MDSMFEIIMISLVTSLPQIAIATVGLVFVHTRLRRFYPRAHFYGTVGLALLLAHGLLVAAFRGYVPYFRQSYDPVAFANLLTKYNLISYVVFSASFVFTLVALLADRSPAKNSRVAA